MKLGQFQWNIMPRSLDYVALQATQFFQRIAAAVDSPSAGITAARPADAKIGDMYFDTTLGFPVWFKSPGWVDATGAPA